MKKCPLCAEEIQDEAIKCKHCGEFLDGRTSVQRPKGKWYFSTNILVISFLCVGPLMLPLIWFNPDYSQNKKIIVSAVILAASVVLMKLMAVSLNNFKTYLDTFNSLLQI